jgi:hypothetical protein
MVTAPPGEENFTALLREILRLISGLRVTRGGGEDVLRFNYSSFPGLELKVSRVVGDIRVRNESSK